MSANVVNPSVSINPQALETLRGWLDKLKAKPPSPMPEDWNLSQMIAFKAEVIPRYGPVFSTANLSNLSRETFLEFLRFENNRHWRGLERPGVQITTDMRSLRAALTILVDEGRPLKDRLERLRQTGGRPMVPYLGQAVITAVLHVEYPERYGVVNNTLKPAMDKIGLWPSQVRDDSLADVFLAVNPIFLELASRLEIDLWTLDYLWWYLAPSPADRSTRGTTQRPREANRVEIARNLGARVAPRSLLESSPSFTLPSGLSFSLEETKSRLERFCRQEFAYYDAVVDHAPSRIEPIDVMVTKAMNSRVNEADQIRSVHRGLAGRCDSLLPKIPIDADLMTYDPQLSQFRELMHAAVQSSGVLIAVATKVLHRKRRNYIPMIDSFVIKHYATVRKQFDWIEKSQNKTTAAAVSVEVVKAFREDLWHAMPHIATIRTSLMRAGFDLTPVRILEVLIWTQVEPNRYYRTG